MAKSMDATLVPVVAALSPNATLSVAPDWANAHARPTPPWRQ